MKHECKAEDTYIVFNPVVTMGSRLRDGHLVCRRAAIGTLLTAGHVTIKY